MNKDQIIKIVKLYLKKVKEAGIPIVDAYIFGSQVKGKTHKGSDIDTGIVSSAFGKDRQQERVRLMNLRDDSTLLIEPHPLSLDDLKSPFNPLISEIKKWGVKIACE